MATPRVLSPQVQIPDTRQSRVSRMPQHDFNLIFKPFQLQPCFIAPVLPGETVTNVHVQVQCWTDPLLSVLKNTGWHFEFYCFYSKFRDLEAWERDEVANNPANIGQAMMDMITANQSLAGLQQAAYVPWSNCAKGGIDYVFECEKRIVDAYFRDEGESWSASQIDSVPCVKLFGKGKRDVLDKLTMATAYTDSRTNLNVMSGGNIYMDDIELAYREWAAAREGNEIPMDYEDWVRASGGRVTVRPTDRDILHVPEDVCHFREFTYPTNTIDMTSGVPRVAAGWRLTKESKQAIRFPEWGWLTGYVCCRPKMLYLNQQGSFAGMMQTRDTWFPPQLDGREYEPHLSVADSNGPLAATMTGGGTHGHYVDLRDLMQSGEQFTNYSPAQASGAYATLPDSSGNRHYVSAADAMSVFTDNVNGRNRADGRVSLTIKGHPATKSDLRRLNLAKV